MAASFLGTAVLGCSTPCDTPVAVYCCEQGCRSDVGIPATCGPSGWTCPPGTVRPSECPEGLVCGGPVGGDGGQP